MKVEYKVDDGRVKWAFRRAPNQMARALDSGLDRAAMEMVKAAQTELRRNDSLAFSTLVMAIAYERSGRFVTVLRPETPVVAPGQAPVTMDLYPQRLRAGAKGVLYFPDENHSRVLALTP